MVVLEVNGIEVIRHRFCGLLGELGGDPCAAGSPLVGVVVVHRKGRPPAASEPARETARQHHGT